MNKEIEIKHEALESLLVGMTENTNKMQENKQHTIQKNWNKSNYKKITMQKEFLSAILHDKKRFDNGVMVLNDSTRLYKKKVWCKWIWARERWNTYYYVYENKKLMDFRRFYEIYRENIVWRKQAIMEIIKKIKNNRKYENKRMLGEKQVAKMEEDRKETDKQ